MNDRQFSNASELESRGRSRSHAITGGARGEDEEIGRNVGSKMLREEGSTTAVSQSVSLVSDLNGSATLSATVPLKLTGDFSGAGKRLQAQELFDFAEEASLKSQLQTNFLAQQDFTSAIREQSAETEVCPDIERMTATSPKIHLKFCLNVLIIVTNTSRSERLLQ